MPATLLIKNTDTGESFDFELTGDVTRIGRAADRNDLVLNDGQSSREHALIRKARNSYELVDLGSANGTFVGTNRVKEHTLENGDSFRISRFGIQDKGGEGAALVKCHDKKKSETVVLRTPSEFTAALPRLDKDALSPQGPLSKSVLA